MAAVKVFGPPMSTAVARVLACLYEKQAEFELVRIDMSKGQHKKPEYLAIQPFGQVPAFQDENVILLGSNPGANTLSCYYFYKFEELVRVSEHWLFVNVQERNYKFEELVRVSEHWLFANVQERVYKFEELVRVSEHWLFLNVRDRERES